MPTKQHKDGVGQRSLYLRTRATCCSMCSAKRSITSSSVPEASPARTMVTECRRENIGEFRQPVGEIPSRHDPVAQTGNDALHPGDVVVCADARKGLVERKARVQQSGKLAGHGGDGRLGDGVERFKEFF